MVEKNKGVVMEITKEQLKEMYNRMTLDSLMIELGITKPTIYKLLKANGIRLKGKYKVRVI